MAHEKRGHPSLASEQLHGGLWAAGCAVCYLAAGAALQTALRFALEGTALGSSGWERLAWGGLLAVTLLAALPPLVLARRAGASGSAMGLNRPGRGGVVPAALCLCAAAPLSWLTEWALGGSAAVALPQDGAARLLAFLQLCAASALAEEVVFRGAIQGLLRPCGGLLAVILQAALFAALHSGPAQQVFALCMGLLLGWTAWSSGSLWPGVGLHFLNNAIAFAGLLRFG